MADIGRKNAGAPVFGTLKPPLFTCKIVQIAVTFYWSSLAQSILSRCFSLFRSVMCILYIFSSNTRHTL